MFAFSSDLGSVQSQTAEVVYSLGLIQENVINFASGASGLTPVPALWKASYSDDLAAVVGFYSDYDEASQDSDSLDQRIQTDSVTAAGQNYATITTLALRQAFGGLQFGGTTDKPYIFLKEISSDGDIQTVDVIFPAYPILVYLNATLGKFLLEPLFENQESGQVSHATGNFPTVNGILPGHSIS